MNIHTSVDILIFYRLTQLKISIPGALVRIYTHIISILILAELSSFYYLETEWLWNSALVPLIMLVAKVHDLFQALIEYPIISRISYIYRVVFVRRLK